LADWLQVGACVPAGRLQTADFTDLADVADRYSSGEVRITCEENVIFPNVKNEDIQAMSKEPIFKRFEIDAGNLMRGLVSCTGSQFCGFGLVETKQKCAPNLDCCSLPVMLFIGSSCLVLLCCQCCFFTARTGGSGARQPLCIF
jgi:dissimilatory sulfite reductase (desulfoviridin) alpha/beta subunit